MGVRAFHSGTGTAERALEEGYETLGNTTAGRNLEKLTGDIVYEPGSPAYNVWARLLAAYAKSIPKGSTSKVFLNNAKPSGIWNMVEKDILTSRNIKIIEVH